MPQQPPERVLAGLIWYKRRAGCYSRALPGTALRQVLLRASDGSWTANATRSGPRRGGATVIWQSPPQDSAAAAAEAARAWAADPLRGAKPVS